MEIIYFLYEIMAGSPTIILPIGFVFGQFGQLGVLNIQSKINLAILCVFPFILFISPFLLLYYELEQETITDKNRENKEEKVDNIESG